MPFSPVWNNVPSEKTVEVLTNHYILHHLNKGTAWIFCPTQNEEKKKGYDASLQNTKIAIIQYKRVHPNQDSIRIDLDKSQHNTLRMNLVKGTSSYVFYCFSRYRSYKELNCGYKSTNTPEFFEKAVFVDAHSLPVGCNSLSFSEPDRLTTSPKLKRKIQWWDGPTWVYKFWQCKLGILGIPEPLQTAPRLSEVGEICVLRWFQTKPTKRSNRRRNQL